MRSDEYKNIFTHQQSLWWYRGMASILRRLLSDYLPNNENLKILDAGCGTGAAFPVLAPFGKVTGIDISDKALSFAKKVGENTKKASVMKLPFPKNSFDAIVSLDVLYHVWVGDYHQALAEYARVLKPGGILFWREPAFDWLKSGHDLVDYTERRFTKDKMKESLLDLPFAIKKLTYLNMIFFPIVIIKRLPSIFHIEKPQAKSDIGPINTWLNDLLTYLFSLESHLISHISFLWGSSIICVAQKK